MFISELDCKLLNRVANELYNSCDVEIIDYNEILGAINNIESLEQCDDRYEICNKLEILRYVYSIILSEVRQKKRLVMSALFEQNPKLAQEKSVLKEKLDADIDYAKLHHQEELLFSFIEHIENIIKSITFMTKDDVYE